MKTTYIQQLPSLLIEVIYKDVKDTLVQAGHVEVEVMLERTMNGRLCDLEESINITKYIDQLDFWKELNREVGEFELGDIVWDKEGNIYLLMRKTDKQKGYISIEDTKSMLRAGEIQSIAVDDYVMTIPFI